jgi:hypothetical protein
MRVILVAATVLALSGSAFAQSVPKYGEVDTEKTPSEIAAEKAAEKAYDRSLGNIPDKGPGDPWGAVRSPGTPKTAATKAKNKAGSVPN